MTVARFTYGRRHGRCLNVTHNGHSNVRYKLCGRCLCSQVAKGAKDSLTEVIRSGDLIAYTAEEAVRYLGEVSELCGMHSMLSLGR